MKDKPILFSGPMVRAILENRKTQTRRIVKPQPEIIPDDCLHGRPPHSYWWRCSGARAMVDIDFMPQVCPYGCRRDRLWVRETWALVPSTAYRQSDGVCQAINPDDHDMAAVYAADWTRSKPGRWRPSIHIPRWASRLTLEVTCVRVERLQDISEPDAKAEGVEQLARSVGTNYRGGDSLNKARAPWESNPWVWVVEFRRVDQ